MAGEFGAAVAADSFVTDRIVVGSSPGASEAGSSAAEPGSNSLPCKISGLAVLDSVDEQAWSRIPGILVESVDPLTYAGELL